MMDEKKILINTQGGPVINGGTFTNVEFVAQKHVYYQEPERKKLVEGIEDAVEVSADEQDEVLELPAVLCTPEAKALHTKLHQENIVDSYWQPIELSNAEKGTLVEYIADKLGIKSKWKLFGGLWKVDGETLRTAKARGLDQDKTWEFRNKLDKL